MEVGPICGVVTGGAPHQNMSWFKHLLRSLRLASGNSSKPLVDQVLNEGQGSSQKKMLVSRPWAAPPYRCSSVRKHQLVGLICF